ncbi:MAG: pyridoxamine 5'-phosphate oxidase family protein [Anaerolineales bacterium]|jgi:PPOX class probable F420-dependent enzyme|uniref:pyridoxamine 5'-phosphate oxidase family protein n=1 Tax=Candidatus Villigracilis vicinus TaxID=3140679 RepID=UPI0031372BE3|nr:pyridoxamine 5'-phosphate oxidase family protein [Anaerolineales bacterium]MBK7451863.1 pyridoxamine 5'-phosphate oxidase family protein [Anaerolineales bacterium]MBK9781463.1 pyridoxamine 5'-phosphate oxidase family protein [Anaerolineales bacterium]
MPFPDKFIDLFQPETKAFLYLATVNSKGLPQVTPVWFDTDGEYILINTNEGRLKDRNMKKNVNVAMVIQNPANPYRYLGMQGRVISYTTEGADEHINMLSERYYGKPWTYREGQKRIIFKIQPISFDEHN